MRCFQIGFPMAAGNRRKARRKNMKYFAYGSNMLLARLSKRVPSAKVFSTGVLTGHRLMWHKKGSDGSGKCDAFQTGKESDLLYGVLFDMAEADKPSLDLAEGSGFGYDEKTVSVFSEADKTMVEALTYYATNIKEGYRPYHWYKSFVLKGAIENNLPDDYVEMIREVESIQDENETRRSFNGNILGL
jgi:hypothetical protein